MPASSLGVWRKPLIRVGLLAIGLAVLFCLGYAALFVVGARRSLPGTPYTLVIAPGVSDEDVQLVQRGLALADRYNRAAFGTTTTQPIEVRLSALVSCIPFDATTGIADAHHLCLYVGGRTWRSLKQLDPVNVLSSVAHEHFHNLQGQWECLRDKAQQRHVWMTEGSANFYSWEAIIAAQLIDRKVALQRQKAWADTTEILLPLSSYETRMGGDKAYFLSRNAFERLNHRVGPKAFAQFCRAASDDWRRAFQRNYGITPQVFYAQP